MIKVLIGNIPSFEQDLPESDYEKLALVFRGIHAPVEMGSLEERIRVQKITYLAQCYGLDLGYKFSWYIRGPYSKQVTSAGFEIYENNIDLAQVQTTQELDGERLEQFRQFITPYMNDTLCLEIESSAVYLRKKSYSGQPLDQTIGYLLEDLTYGYKNFDEDLVRNVLTELSQANLLTN